jgi:nucleotide-binding universal stress UspA family protein
MITIKRILCPVDFFPASDRAVKYAAGLAANYGARVHLLHALAPIVSTPYEYPIATAEIMRAAEKASADELKKLAAKVEAKGVKVETQIRPGAVPDVIKKSISVLKPDLIAMGTHSRGTFERLFMGSVSEWLIRHSPVPVLTMSAKERLTTPAFRKIFVTTDFSDGTADALDYAFSIAQENDSQVTFLHVVSNLVVDIPTRYRDSLLSGVQKQLEDLVPAEVRNWCNVTTRVEFGNPYRLILRVLDKEKPDLLVMNIHGKSMMDRAMIGSTAERVVRAAKCPVLLIPPFKKAKTANKARSTSRAA